MSDYNVTMKQLNSSGDYDNIYPKSSPNQEAEGDYQVGDIKQSVRGIARNWHLCDGSEIENNKPVFNILPSRLKVKNFFTVDETQYNYQVHNSQNYIITLCATERANYFVIVQYDKFSQEIHITNCNIPYTREFSCKQILYTNNNYYISFQNNRDYFCTIKYDPNTFSITYGTYTHCQAYFYGFYYFESKFFIVASKAIVQSSTDGLTWTQINTGIGYKFGKAGLGFVNSRYYLIAYSTDDWENHWYYTDDIFSNQWTEFKTTSENLVDESSSEIVIGKISNSIVVAISSSYDGITVYSGTSSDNIVKCYEYPYESRLENFHVLDQTSLQSNYLIFGNARMGITILNEFGEVLKQIQPLQTDIGVELISFYNQELAQLNTVSSGYHTTYLLVATAFLPNIPDQDGGVHTYIKVE